MVTIAFHTARRDPKFSWLFDSIRRQKGISRVTQIIVVDYYAQTYADWSVDEFEARNREIFLASAANRMSTRIDRVAPKPNIWQGEYRITKENWWAMSNCRNTSFCLCRNPWIVLLDDRCVLSPDWMSGVRRAMAGNYIAFGSYEKHYGLSVRNGVVQGSEKVTGVDNRLALARGRTVKANGAWAYGCNLALPLELALQVNGYPERADGLSFEDVLFGMVLHNNGFPMRYDPAMKVTQDRTPSELDAPFKRSDKGVSPNDKSHASLTVIGGVKRSENEHNLRAVREAVLKGEPFPLPDPTKEYRDWYDNSLIKDA
jgi:hypothetical protein